MQSAEKPKALQKKPSFLTPSHENDYWLGRTNIYLGKQKKNRWKIRQILAVCSPRRIPQKTYPFWIRVFTVQIALPHYSRGFFRRLITNTDSVVTQQHCIIITSHFFQIKCLCVEYICKIRAEKSNQFLHFLIWDYSNVDSNHLYSNAREVHSIDSRMKT